MASLKKIATAVTAGVWLSALGSAAALAYVLNRPLEPRTFPEPLTAHASVGHPLGEAPPSVKLVDAPPLVIAMPATRQVHAPKPKPAPVDTVRDIKDMKCDQWRELQVGSGRVQVCD